LTGALVADTGGLLRALAGKPSGGDAWPEYAGALRLASRVILPALVLAEVDYFLRNNRPAMRRLVGEIFDPKTTYEFEPSTAHDITRALELDAKFATLELGLVDGIVAAVAERRGIYRILTTDRNDFAPLRVGPTLRRPFMLVP
jgi:predicted nucleic acid-binding protein